MPTVIPLCLGWMSNATATMIPGASGRMRYPIPGYAVVHERGVVVFDTGLPAALQTSTDSLGPLAKVFVPEVTPDQMVDKQLAAAGIDPGAVTHVVNSHLHFDHCGCNGPLAHATTLIQHEEWEAAHRPDPFSYVGVPLDEVAAGDVRLIDGPLDVFDDGTVVCVPTPGHTPGHQSLLVLASTIPDAAEVLLVGDACYVRELLTRRLAPTHATDVPGQLASYEVLAGYEARGTTLLFSHDVDEWDVVPADLRPITAVEG